jgi:protease IV
VIVQTQNVGPFLDKLGVQSGSVQSGKYKDILSPFRSATEGDRKIIQGIVSDSYEQFLASIVEGRNISLAELRPLADGRIYTGAQAKAVKLVDSLGNYRDAVKKTAELVQINGEPKIRSYSSKGLSESILGRLLPFSTSSLIPIESSSFSAAYRDKVPMALME